MGRVQIIAVSTAVALLTRAGQADPPPVPLRLMTCNVLHGVGAPGSGEAVALGKFLTRLDADGTGPNTGLVPDIACLQECDVAAFSDLTNYITTNLRYPVNGVPTNYVIHGADGDGFNFNAILRRPDIPLLRYDNVSNSGPRNWVRVTIKPVGALRTLTIYTAHFKAFSDTASMNSRRAEANQLGQFIYNDLTLGLDLDGNGSRETPCGDLLICGDFNSNDNTDGTISGLFTHSTLGVPTGVLNLPVERLSGRFSIGAPSIATYPSSSVRFDYICTTASLAAPFDLNGNGLFERATSAQENDQAEINAMGFVYFSNDGTPEHAAGQWANGDPNATSNASDHRPVVFDLKLARDPNVPYFDPRDLNHDGLVDAEDLQLWETAFDTSSAPDVDGNRNIDLNDRGAIRSETRANEQVDVGL